MAECTMSAPKNWRANSAPVIASEAKQSRGRARRPLDCFVARAPRNDEGGVADSIDSVVVGRRLSARQPEHAPLRGGSQATLWLLHVAQRAGQSDWKAD